MNPDLRRWTGHLAGDSLPKLGQLQEYVSGFSRLSNNRPLGAVGEEPAYSDQDLMMDATVRQCG
jgi:hypothetical protein